MSRQSKGSGSDRRDFLKLAGLGTLTGGAALLAKGQAQAAVRDDDQKDDRYRETEHVKTYYELAKF